MSTKKNRPNLSADQEMYIIERVPVHDFLFRENAVKDGVTLTWKAPEDDIYVRPVTLIDGRWHVHGSEERIMTHVELVTFLTDVCDMGELYRLDIVSVGTQK